MGCFGRRRDEETKRVEVIIKKSIIRDSVKTTTGKHVNGASWWCREKCRREDFETCSSCCYTQPFGEE